MALRASKIPHYKQPYTSRNSFQSPTILKNSFATINIKKQLQTKQDSALQP